MFFAFLFIKNMLHTSMIDFSDVDVDIPKNYSFLEAYPECDFGPLVQNCGCCFAITPLKSLAHRYCRATHKMLVLSHQYVVNCDVYNQGCEGGNERNVFYLLENYGVPDEDCFPWQAIKEYKPERCKKCYGNKPMKFFKALKRSTRHYVGIDNIKKGIFLEGPVSASVTSDYNFIWYREGLYTSTANSMNYNEAANHTVVILGWGEYPNGTQYWLVQNAFGTMWGTNGVMKMLLGTNEGYIEDNVVGALPDLSIKY
jgi:C1A family cysteine protease